MPSMANITVKKNDGTTDIIYDALSASAGDGVPAFWRQDTGSAAGLPVGLRATFSVATAWNGPKTARVLRAKFSRPYATLDTTTQLYSAKDKAVGELSIVLPQNLPSSEINEAVSQMFNLIASTLVKDQGRSGYAAT